MAFPFALERSERALEQLNNPSKPKLQPVMEEDMRYHAAEICTMTVTDGSFGYLINREHNILFYEKTR